MKIHNRERQQGVVLIVSLLILLVLTMIGISAISNTTMEERMSNNFQQSMVAFQASETAIAKTITAGDPGGTGTAANPFYVSASDPLQQAVVAGLNKTTTTTKYVIDATSALDSTATVSYTGTTQLCPGFGGSVSCVNFEITTNTTLANTDTDPTHVQGVSRPAPGG